VTLQPTQVAESDGDDREFRHTADGAVWRA
jgi:hypothetical protein